MQSGFFDIENSYARLEGVDNLQKLDKAIDWSGLATLMQTVSFDVLPNGRGRRPLSGLLMGKVLLLQAINNLSDDMTEFLINDRLSFKRFLGLHLNDKSPDAKTIWLWRERVKYQGLDTKILDWFGSVLEKAGFEAKSGQIVDASFVPAHKPTGKHKKQLSEEIPLTKHQVAQIDSDATFTKKRNETYHGYKNHVRIDAEYKLIRAAEVTTASLHDSQICGEILAMPAENTPEEAKNIYADSAYRSEKIEANLTAAGLHSHIHERAYRNKPLTPEQKQNNHGKSKIRARVEHVFGHMNTSMNGLLIHTIGIARVKVKITFKNIAYNMQRFACLLTQRQLQRQKCA